MRRISLIFLLTILSTGVVLAGNTGKISGRVVDKQIGEPLIGVNVTVMGTNLGAATDEDGFYFIIQVPPGTYDVEFNYLGYHTLTVKGLRVKVDLTQNVNVAMESKAVEGPTIEVVAEQVLVQKDVTATRKTASREEINTTPGFQSTSDIFRLQGASFVDVGAQSIAIGDGNQLQVRDESLKDIHIRGGRGGEILYMVDGVPVTHPIYGGRDVLNLNVVDVQEMELLTGAFNAEYGKAQSGVVNITTRSGGNRYQGGVEYKSGELDFISKNYAFQYTSLYLGGPEPITNYFLPKIGVEIPGRLFFFLSGNTTLSNTPYNNNRTREDVNILGFNVRALQDNTGNLNAKLSWDASNRFSATFSYHGSTQNWSPFDYLFSNYPDNLAGFNRKNRNFNLSFKHTISKSTFYNLNFGYLGVDYKGSLYGLNPSEYWLFYKDNEIYNYDSFMRNFPGQAPDSVLHKTTNEKIGVKQKDNYGFWNEFSFPSIR